MNIVIYSTKTCGYCHMLKGYLDQKNIKYESRMADENPKYAEELYKISGQMGVPFSVVTDDKGKETRILGFDKPAFDQILGL